MSLFFRASRIDVTHLLVSGLTTLQREICLLSPQIIAFQWVLRNTQCMHWPALIIGKVLLMFIPINAPKLPVRYYFKLFQHFLEGLRVLLDLGG